MAQSDFPTAIHELATNKVVLVFMEGYKAGYEQGESYNPYEDQVLWEAYNAGYDKGVADYCYEMDNGDQNHNDDMDGDHASALASAGFGTDEDYGYFGGDEY